MIKHKKQRRIKEAITLHDIRRKRNADKIPQEIYADIPQHAIRHGDINKLQHYIKQFEQQELLNDESVGSFYRKHLHGKLLVNLIHSISEATAANNAEALALLLPTVLNADLSILETTKNVAIIDGKHVTVVEFRDHYIREALVVAAMVGFVDIVGLLIPAVGKTESAYVKPRWREYAVTHITHDLMQLADSFTSATDEAYYWAFANRDGKEYAEYSTPFAKEQILGMLTPFVDADMRDKIVQIRTEWEQNHSTAAPQHKKQKTYNVI